jgi:hypothetical protein
LIYTPDPNKMEQPCEGPHPVIRVHTNKTVTFQKGPVTQNIRQIVTFQERPLIREESALRVDTRVAADGQTGLQPVRAFNHSDVDSG